MAVLSIVRDHTDRRRGQPYIPMRNGERFDQPVLSPILFPINTTFLRARIKREYEHKVFSPHGR